MATKPETVPATCSARATAASFEDWISSANINSRTEMRSPTRRPRTDPDWKAAVPSATTVSFGFTFAITTRAVMTFVRLAMGRRPSGAFEYRTWPVSRSSRMADGEASRGGVSDGRGVCRAVGNGDGEPSGGTGVGGGVEVARAAGTRQPIGEVGMTTSASAAATTAAPDLARGRRMAALLATSSAGTAAGSSGAGPASASGTVRPAR